MPTPFPNWKSATLLILCKALSNHITLIRFVSFSTTINITTAIKAVWVRAINCNVKFADAESMGNPTKS
jgi:hypothetical protein